MNLRFEIVDDIKELPTMSSTIVKLGQLINDPDSEIEDLVNVLQLDPGITANLLKLANSAAFGLPRKVSSIKEAVVRIGIKKLYQIAMASSLKPMINQPLNGYEMDAGDYWKHNIAVAIASEQLALLTKKKCEIFTAGIIHDVGKQVISNYIGKQETQFGEEEDNESSFNDTEKKILGIDHAELGALILEKWQFPQSLINTTRFHHTPDEATEYQDEVDIIHIADIICSSAGFGMGYDSMRYEISVNALKRLEMTDDILQEVLSITVEKTEEFENLVKEI